MGHSKCNAIGGINLAFLQITKKKKERDVEKQMEEVSGQKEQRVYAASSNWNSIGTSVLAACQGSPVHLALDSAFPDLPIQSHLPQQEMESTQAILTDSSSRWPCWFHPDRIPGSGKWPLAITMLSSSQLLQKKSQLITKSQ